MNQIRGKRRTVAKALTRFDEDAKDGPNHVSRLLYIVDWLPPENGAVGQYALLESEQLARAGARVVLAGFSTTGASREVSRLGSGELVVVRLKRPAFDRNQLKRRAMWTLRSNITLAVEACRWLPQVDEVLFTGSPPFLEYFVPPLAWLFGTSPTFRIADFHPECMIAELGDRSPQWLERFAEVTRAVRRRLPRLEVLGEDAKALLIADGVSPARIVVRRSDSPVKFLGQKPMARPKALQNRPVILYSGAAALPHEFDTFISAYAKHHAHGSASVVLWLNATGAKAEAVASALVERQLPFHRTRGVSIDKLASLLLSVDAHLVTLKDQFVGVVVPSKMYACIDSGRDVLFVGSTRSDVHANCSRALAASAYHQAAVGEIDKVADALERIARRYVVRAAEVSSSDSVAGDP